MKSSAKPIDRLYFLDWLRILAFAGLVIYHVGMYYVSWDFHVKSPFAGHGLEPWMKLTEPWRMSLLFVISGAATAYMMKGGTSLGLVRRRSARLLLPLLLGMVILVPPQSYFQVVQKFGYSGDYLDFLSLYFGHFQGFCSDGHCLILPTWNHLWFLPYLWAYTLLLIGLSALWPTALQRASQLSEVALRGVWLMAIPIVLMLSARLLLLEKYPSTHALFGDWFNHATFLSMFLFGAAFATSNLLWTRLESLRWFALIHAVVFWTMLVFVRPAKPFEHAVVAIYQWSAIVAAIGFSKAHLNSDSPLRRRLTEAVFPVYILHQTIIVLASQALLPLQLRPPAEGPLIILVTFGISYAGYELVRRISLLRPWFGLKAVSKEFRTQLASGA